LEIFNENFDDNSIQNIHQIALTISAANDLISIADTELLRIIKEELIQISGNKNIEILAYRIIKDKNATPLITFENNSLRPQTVTEISNFYLAGDWIQTELPATIESVALSGKLAADTVFQKNTYCMPLFNSI